MKKIILASTSIPKKEVFKKLGIRFGIQANDFEEDLTLKIPPEKMVKYFSREKAKSVAINNKKAIVIGADTIIVLKNKILGKPHTPKGAKKMLRLISGQTISIITGFTIIDTVTNKSLTKATKTKAKIKRLSTAEINNYVRTKEPLDKAGAFGIQGIGSLLVEKINGDYYNIVGLPLFDLAQSLKKFKVSIL